MEFSFNCFIKLFFNVMLFQMIQGQYLRGRGGFLGTGSYGIGVSCDYDDECMLPHTYCYRQETCQCKRGFQPSEDGSQCITMVGAFCQTAYDCNTLEHSECQQESCQCAQGYVPNKQGTECQPLQYQLRGPCSSDAQCQSAMGLGSYCLNGCQCLFGNHYSQLERLCLENIGLYQSCRNNSQCYIGEEYTSTIECYNGKCKCRYGYYITADNKCASCSSIIQGSVIIIILGIFLNN